MLPPDAPACGWPQNDLPPTPPEEEHDGHVRHAALSGSRASAFKPSRSSVDRPDLIISEDVNFTEDTPYLVLMRTMDGLIQGNMPSPTHVSGIILLRWLTVHVSPFTFVLVSPFTSATVGLTLTPLPPPACDAQLSNLRMWLSNPEHLLLPLVLLQPNTSFDSGGISDQVLAMSRTRRSSQVDSIPNHVVARCAAQRSVGQRSFSALSHASAHA